MTSNANSSQHRPDYIENIRTLHSYTSTVQQIDSGQHVVAEYDDDSANSNDNNIIIATALCVSKSQHIAKEKDTKSAAGMTKASQFTTTSENQYSADSDFQQLNEFAVIVKESNPCDDYDDDDEQTILNDPHVTVDGITTDNNGEALEETLDEHNFQALAIHNHHDDHSPEEGQHGSPLILPYAPDYQHLNGLLRRVLHQVQLTVRDANGNMRPQWQTVNEVTFAFENDIHPDPRINRRDIIQVGTPIITCDECFRNYQSDVERIVGPFLQPGDSPTNHIFVTISGHTDSEPIPATPPARYRKRNNLTKSTKSTVYIDSEM
ncbi:hypothetical protein BDB00DRAFT_783988 [Zychaea mexicana]|uniref:uncharacterized protein n=1 Tax=Zychaea mexicana TaxID=64656 RepID=UPI0022FE865E|nr:uncharacterized protein BDB00DRAFT_783988 [Zychaea mexicana]KAI9498364.1 hypothetical protein BDB00DRAFT_783988 [Zychaea mexicana]